MPVDAGLCYLKDKALIPVITGLTKDLVDVYRFVLMLDLLLWEQEVPGSNPGAPTSLMTMTYGIAHLLAGCAIL